MGKKFSGVSQTMSRFRGWIQAGAALLTNLHLPNFLKGGLYQGAGKTVCVPGLNCYSCPAASGACPIGSFQAVVGSSKFRFSYYITGFLILLGVLLGRFICGFLCPFGWFQELLHKIPTINGLNQYGHTPSVCCDPRHNKKQNQQADRDDSQGNHHQLQIRNIYFLCCINVEKNQNGK